jgi:hypothetical protein
MRLIGIQFDPVEFARRRCLLRHLEDLARGPESFENLPNCCGVPKEVIGRRESRRDGLGGNPDVEVVMAEMLFLELI